MTLTTIPNRSTDPQIVQLIDAVISNNHILPYINLDNNNAYKGWVADFHFAFIDGNQMQLNLQEKNDLFLLFVLAVAWSRSGRWENAAYFVAHLKYNHLDSPSFWLSEPFITEQSSAREQDAAALNTYCVGLQSRIKISFRKDIYKSIHILAAHWDEILSVLVTCSKQGNYIDFIRFIRSIDGLGAHGNRMNMKILLILRELRCQNIYATFRAHFAASRTNAYKIPAVH